jgi:hypothetical protein
MVRHLKLQRELYGGIQKIYKFDNNYGASVVNHSGSYGSDRGLWELAVLFFESDDDWDLCYTTPITNDVMGYLEEARVEEILVEIKAL